VSSTYRTPAEVSMNTIKGCGDSGQRQENSHPSQPWKSLASSWDDATSQQQQQQQQQQTSLITHNDYHGTSHITYQECDDVVSVTNPLRLCKQPMPRLSANHAVESRRDASSSSCNVRLNLLILLQHHSISFYLHNDREDVVQSYLHRQAWQPGVDQNSVVCRLWSNSSQGMS
jgi:hypothetical protein